MSEFGETWKFTRVRLDASLEGLTDEQMSWRPHENAHTIFELLYHIAGCEHHWATRMTRRSPEETDFDAKLDQAAKDGFLREGGCPFDEMSLPAARRALDYAREEIEIVICRPTAEQLAMTLLSPIGDTVTGREGLARLAQHAGYHTGQIWMMRMDPCFPAG